MESQSSNSTPPPARLHPAQIQGKEKYVRDTFREEAGLSDAQRVHIDESSWILLTSSNSSSSRFHEDFPDLMLEMCSLLGGIAAFKWDASPPGF
ncbi:hypothetical protein E1301_Tti008511 [Triplophysa tibetana]|uniref:Uncharacterized protein n=1 Tax=Triplophysa tibetana TaxID=1572043 RepID=A0A5A9P0S4_9TELE|nr:hypothetical protein E1301_Tti008511 [Triplophysa tibetana]